VVKIRKAYARAIKLYEKGLKALQRRNFRTAKTAFQQLLDQYPEEKELHDRAKLYLNVCAREAGPKAKPPKTTAERLLAATVALNRRDVEEALSLLRKAAKTYPNDDHVHYMLAVTHALREDAEAAAAHLNKAIELNPDNQLQAKQEPDFDLIRESKPFLEAIATS
jgi:tetratricopeptide (TPR) repeat protein